MLFPAFSCHNSISLELTLTAVNCSKRPKNAETHFKVVVVSSKFDDVKGLGRHRIVNSILAKEIATEGPVHALSIVAKTPAQWKEMELTGSGNVVIDKSPSCRGGDGSLPSK